MIVDPLARHIQQLTRGILLGAACLWMCACDDPPDAPAPSVDIDQQRAELRDQVDKTKSRARSRIETIAKRIPAADAGRPDTSSDQ